MQQAFPGAGIAHVQRISALNDLVFDEIVLHQRIDAFDANFGRNVAGFQIADQGMNVDTVANFHGDFAKIFMGTVHGVSQLQGRNFAPAAFFKNFAGFFRSHVNTGILGRDIRLRSAP